MMSFSPSGQKQTLLRYADKVRFWEVVKTDATNLFLSKPSVDAISVLYTAITASAILSALTKYRFPHNYGHYWEVAESSQISHKKTSEISIRVRIF